MGIIPSYCTNAGGIYSLIGNILTTIRKHLKLIALLFLTLSCFIDFNSGARFFHRGYLCNNLFLILCLERQPIKQKQHERELYRYDKY